MQQPDFSPCCSANKRESVPPSEEGGFSFFGGDFREQKQISGCLISKRKLFSKIG